MDQDTMDKTRQSPQLQLKPSTLYLLLSKRSSPRSSHRCHARRYVIEYGSEMLSWSVQNFSLQKDFF